MKTTEFIKKVEQLRYEVVDNITDMIICRNGNIVARVCNNKVNKLDTLWEEDVPHYLLHLCVEYARTPIEERKSEKKYYLRLPIKGNPAVSYLNYNAENGVFNFSSYTESHSWMTQFTQNEINSLPSQDFIKTLIKEEVK